MRHFSFEEELPLIPLFVRPSVHMSSLHIINVKLKQLNLKFLCLSIPHHIYCKQLIIGISSISIRRAVQKKLTISPALHFNGQKNKFFFHVYKYYIVFETRNVIFFFLTAPFTPHVRLSTAENKYFESRVASMHCTHILRRKYTFYQFVFKASRNLH